VTVATLTVKLIIVRETNLVVLANKFVSKSA